MSEVDVRRWCGAALAVVVAAVGLGAGGVAEAAGPAHFLSVTPADGAGNVALDTSVTLLPSVSVDAATVSDTTVQLLDGSILVPGTYNSDAAGGVISLTPKQSLKPTHTYTVKVSSGVLSLDGEAFQPFTSSFRTGTEAKTPDLKLKLDRTNVGDLTGPSALAMGPDGKLYVGTGVGDLYRYTLDANGAPVGGPQLMQPFGAFTRTITGIHFAPGSTAGDLRLYVSSGALGFEDMPNFTGTVSLLSGPDLATVQDVIVGLPRSVHDHMNNSIEFGPDGRMYLSVGSLSGYGQPDGYWGLRAETPLAGAVLVIDLGNPAFAGGHAVDVDTSKGYDWRPASAPVRLYATGLRNAFDLLWHSNGKLYTAGNESASGNAPAGPSGNPPALNGLLSGRDYFTRVVQGRYYGHPNPSIGNYVLNGGNPTVGQDPFEVPEYPVGTKPDPDWYKPELDLGKNRSPDGLAEYTSNAFGSALKGKILVAEFSNGDDILAIGLGSGGGVASVGQVASGFNNPLDVIATPDGRIYVAEYGEQPSGEGGRVTLLTKALGTSVPFARVDFTTAGAPLQQGYTRDTGQGYSSSRGYGWVPLGSHDPLDLTKNTRRRNRDSDSRLDTLIHMQYTGPASEGTRTEGRWELAAPNGVYDVTVWVGDANDTNDSRHRINVEGTTAIDTFIPETTAHYRRGDVRVLVTDGRLTLDAIGGVNTKLLYVDVNKVDLPTDGGTPPTTAPQVLPEVVAAGSTLVPMTPTRLLDTRIGQGVAAPGALPAHGTVRLPVRGVAGIPDRATAVVLNVTATEANPGYVQVLPTGGSIGTSSSLNVERPGQTIANLVVVPIGADGSVTFYADAGAQLVADVSGWFELAGKAVAAGRYVGGTPVRTMDTRIGLGANGGVPGRLAGGTPMAVPLGPPPTDVRAVVLNVTATEAAADGYVQLLPAGAGGYGTSSNLNVTAGQTIANLVVVPVSAAGVEVYAQSDVHLVVDVVGWFTGARAPSSTAGLFLPVGPARLLDTRQGTAPAAGGFVDLSPKGQVGIPDVGVAAVVLNVTATNAAAPGYVQVLPAGGAFGSSSTLNVERAGQTIPNASFAALGVGGRVSMFTQSGTDLLADVFGFFTG